MNTFAFLFAIQPDDGVPALRHRDSRLRCSPAVGAGVFIYGRRDQLFGCDPEVVNDTPVVRHNRAEEIAFVFMSTLRGGEKLVRTGRIVSWLGFILFCVSPLSPEFPGRHFRKVESFCGAFGHRARELFAGLSGERGDPPSRRLRSGW